jgi:hypothetical protein
MPPFPPSSPPLTVRSSTNQIENIPFDTTKIVEAWAQGFNVGALVLLILFTLCNYRRHVLLHKLILIQVGTRLLSIKSIMWMRFYEHEGI